MTEGGRGIGDRGSGKVKLWLVLSALVVAVAVVVVIAAGRGVPSPPQPQSSETAVEGGCGAPRTPQSEPDEAASEDDSEPEEADEPQTEEERREAEEEELVDAFDELTDRWQEPAPKGLTMADVDNFTKAFRKIPKSRQDECIHRALNLIPDENVMLLAGVLMDRTADREIVEEVYNDILNRDEDVKKPILREIFKDRAHPCWADTAWILDVTDDLPGK